MLATVIARLGIPFLVSVIGGALGAVNNPVAQTASKALENFEGAMAAGAISAEQMAEANRHAEKMAEMKAREYESILAEVNETIRAEASSNDPYVRRMRPTFGYLMAITWAAQMLALAYIVVFDTEKAAEVLTGMESLTAIWAVGLSVLGIYVYKRSEEKKKIFAALQSPAPQTPPSPLSSANNLKPKPSPKADVKLNN
jgi:hypothetical protein